MTDLEMKMEALIRCVGPAAFSRAMAQIQKQPEPTVWQPKELPAAKEIQKAARELLTELGMPAHLLGYHYSVTALRLMIEEPGYLKAMTKELYPDVGQIHDTDPARVARTIRHGVECVWGRGQSDMLERYWGNSINPYSEWPSNSEFLAKCAELLRERLGIEDA